MLGVSELNLYLVCGLPGAGKTTRSRQIIAALTAVHLCPDEWVTGLGLSLVDYEFRVKLQGCLLAHAGQLLRCGLSVVIEFGSWSRAEREAIRQVAVRAGATSELHYLDAPLDELVRRVLERGGPCADILASKVLLQESSRFERPSADEIAGFDRYFGPADEWPSRAAPPGGWA
jgi:predicted kinase